MEKCDDALEAARQRLQARLAQGEAERQEAERKRLGACKLDFTGYSDPNLIGRKLQNIEHFLIIGASIFE